MKGLMKQRRASKQREGFFPKISRREKEVLRLIIQEHTTQEIADKLFISSKTAENHRSNIMRKLGLHSTIELVRYAAKIGLIDIDLWKE